MITAPAPADRSPGLSVATTTGPQVLDQAVPVSAAELKLIARGVAALWSRIVAASPQADLHPLLLSYDVHPGPGGPVLIEVNTNAGGVLSAIAAARHLNGECSEWEQARLRERLLALFRRDLLGDDPQATVAIVDDQLATQPLLGEMHELAAMMRGAASDVRVVDAAELTFGDGRLRHQGVAIDRVYWRSTDFMLAEPVHAPVRRAVDEGTTTLAPAPEAYRAIADKRRFVDWSREPELARDDASGLAFRVAETLPMAARPVESWYADRSAWVFKPVSGHGGRGVYVGRSVSRTRLAALPPDQYLAQRYAPHPAVDRDGVAWKYDLRFFADRGQIIGAAARVFQGQVVGMRAPGSGFAPIRVDTACCLVGALVAARPA